MTDWRRFLDGCKRKKSSEVTSERREYSWKQVNLHSRGRDGVSSESCIFKVAVKYLTVVNMAHKQDTNKQACVYSDVYEDISFWCKLVTSFSKQQECFLQRQLKPFIPGELQIRYSRSNDRAPQKHDLHWGRWGQDSCTGFGSGPGRMHGWQIKRESL